MKFHFRILVLYFGLLPLSAVNAKEISTIEESSFFVELFGPIAIGFGVIVFIYAGLFLFFTLFKFSKDYQIHLLREQGKIKELNALLTEKIPLGERLKKRLINIVPIDQEEDILFDHTYDGIEELDNNLPPWWLYGFYLTIVIGVAYMGYYHFSDDVLSTQDYYYLEMEAAEIAKEEFLERQANKIDESNIIALIDKSSLSAGRGVFKTNCVTCHMEHGGGAPGSVGPNLTDEYWLHGGGIKEVFKTIKYGVPAKGMIAWKDQMSPSDMHKVASYILSIQGTNPPNAKEPQGEIYKVVAEND